MDLCLTLVADVLLSAPLGAEERFHQHALNLSWRLLARPKPVVSVNLIFEDRSDAGVNVAPLEWIEDAGLQTESPEPQELKPR